LKVRVNRAIRASKLRVIDNEEGNLGILTFEEALKKAEEKGLDLIEISPQADPPIAKIMDFGKWQYTENKKQKKAKAGAKASETKSIQVKIGTGEHDLELKAKNASNWLKEGHRIKIELYLSGRAKYLDEKFLRDRIERILNLITENYKISDPYKKGPKGPTVTIERSK